MTQAPAQLTLMGEVLSIFDASPGSRCLPSGSITSRAIRCSDNFSATLSINDFLSVVARSIHLAGTQITQIRLKLQENILEITKRPGY